MHHESILKKIPGNLQPQSRQEGQGYIDDLCSKKLFELEELLERQNKLLNNKKFISKLPDKGLKITKFRDKILDEINSKMEIENAANILSRLNIASEGKAAMNELEWTGKYSDEPKVEKVIVMDSDDEDDPLKILAQPTGSGVHKKKVIILPAEESLIRPEDLDEIEMSQDSSEVEHVKYITEMVEKPKIDEKHKREFFKPFKTTKTNVHDPSKELQRKRDEHWEVTAATPPPSIHGQVKPLNIQESLILQKVQAEKLQEIQTRNALLRLSVSNVSASKNLSDSENENEDEENEVHDDEDNDKAGTVVYNIESMES